MTQNADSVAVTLTINVDVVDVEATLAQAAKVAEANGWDASTDVARAVADIVNSADEVGYLAYFADLAPNGRRGGWVVEAAQIDSSGVQSG